MAKKAEHNKERHIGNYRIIERIGSGYSGVVFKAQHTLLTSRPLCAIKLMNHSLFLDNRGKREKFIGEARLLDRLDHKYILHFIDVGMDEEQGSPYIVTLAVPCEIGSGASSNGFYLSTNRSESSNRLVKRCPMRIS